MNQVIYAQASHENLSKRLYYCWRIKFFSKALEEVRKSLMNETTVSGLARIILKTERKSVSGKLEIKMYVSNIS
jgi:hypothetical protein